MKKLMTVKEFEAKAQKLESIAIRLAGVCMLATGVALYFDSKWATLGYSLTLVNILFALVAGEMAEREPPMELAHLDA